MLAEPTQRLHPDLAGLQETFSLQREAAAREPYPDAATRDRRLAALERLLRTNVDAIAGAIARDFGHRSHHETRLLEIFPSLEAAKHARRHLRRWMKPERRGVSLWFQPGRARIFAQPLGRRRHRRAVELPDLPRRRPARRRAGGRQPRDDQDVGAGARHRGIAGGARRRIVRPRRGVRRQR